MTINDIIALANAGFNAQQIAQFAQVQPKMPQMPQAQTQMPQAQTQMPQAQPQMPQAQPQMPQAQPQMPQAQPQMPQAQPQMPQAQPQMPPGYDPFTVIMNKLGGIQQTMQAGNIMGMNMTPPQENTDTILASIINPPQKGDGK